MDESRQIWIAYNGGSNALQPRPITPLNWVKEPQLISALCGQAQIVKTFSTGKIQEIRDQQWWYICGVVFQNIYVASHLGPCRISLFILLSKLMWMPKANHYAVTTHKTIQVSLFSFKTTEVIFRSVPKKNPTLLFFLIFLHRRGKDPKVFLISLRCLVILCSAIIYYLSFYSRMKIFIVTIFLSLALLVAAQAQYDEIEFLLRFKVSLNIIHLYMDRN